MGAADGSALLITFYVQLSMNFMPIFHVSNSDGISVFERDATIQMRAPLTRTADQGQKQCTGYLCKVI